jgi:hypothetical protein
MSTEEKKINAALEDEGDTIALIDLDNSKKKKKKVKKRPVADAQPSNTESSNANGEEKKEGCTEADAESMFNLNKVPGHEEYQFEFMLERIEQIMAMPKDADSQVESFKVQDPITKPMGTTKTTWINF